jgi:hypothetical protein
VREWGDAYGRLRLGLIVSCLLFYIMIIFILRFIDAAAGIGSGQNIVKCLEPTLGLLMIWHGCAGYLRSLNGE